MVNKTLEISNWDQSIWTFSDEIQGGITKQYEDHFSKIVERFSNENSSYNESREKDLKNLVDYKFPQKISFDFLGRGNSYAKKFTKMKGFVTSIEDDYFTAYLFEKDVEGAYEEGEFNIEDIDKDDRDLFKIGGVFYWTFGHFVLNGQVKKMSEIRFQRLPNLSTDEFDRIYDEAKELNDSLDWD